MARCVVIATRSVFFFELAFSNSVQTSKLVTFVLIHTTILWVFWFYAHCTFLHSLCRWYKDSFIKLPNKLDDKLNFLKKLT